jgi:hypothetical protein
VAVKVFRLDITPEQARALADELGRAVDASLFHPAIVEPVAAGIEGTVAYRAEEYVAAESLDVAMRHYAPATVEKVLPFITQLASGIDFARAAGVGHGALHPRDIFITPDEARATGFGVVDALDRMKLRAPVRRPYSPPERIAGRPWGTTADVFSLGVIAFELLTGRRPSGLGDEMGSLSGAPLGEHASAVRVVLARAMQENPYERYATAEAFSAAVAQAASVPETTVSLVTRIVAVPPATVPEPEIRIAPPEPVASPAGSVDELPLAVQASADQPAHDLVIQYDPDTNTPDADHVLDVFGAESEVPFPGDSPREVARKMIAAREVRKRQVKKKAEKATDDGSMDAAPSLPGQDSAVPAHPVAGALFDAQSADAPPPVLLNALDVKNAAKENGQTSTVDPAAKALEDDAQVAALEAVDLALATREPLERVVAVDEFRAREAASPKPDRNRPRVPERIAPGWIESGQRDLEDARPERAALSKASAIESIDPDVTPLPLEEPPPERQRLVMLQVAVWISLGLVLGYAAGYIRGSRETLAASGTAVATRTSAESQTPTTGRTPAKETTEQVVTPTNAPAVPPAASRAPAAPATVAPVTAPGAKPTTTAAAALTRGPAATPAPKPAPSPREARPAAATGRIVVHSTPSKAQVVINGKWTGRTPLTVDDLRFGAYVVRVIEPGYEAVREEFTLSPAAATQTMNVTLRRRAAPPPAAPSAKPPAAATGDVYVDSRPRGARVFIDGKEVGVTPLTLTGQAVGSRVVRLELADHQSPTVTTEVTAQKTARVTLSLERIK